MAVPQANGLHGPVSWVNRPMVGWQSTGADDVTAPNGICVPRWVSNDPQTRAVMSEIITVGLDLAKKVFQVNGADASGRA